MKISISRPRVYLIDFETAVQFSAGCSSIERVSVGYPVTENYSRPCAPELASGKAYNPFKLDVWQLGNSFSGFKVRQCIFFTVILFAYRLSVSQSTIPKVDEVLAAMTDIDPVHRLDAKEAKDRLGTIINYMAPASLLIKPDNAEHGLPWYPAYYCFLIKEKREEWAAGIPRRCRYQWTFWVWSQGPSREHATGLGWGPAVKFGSRLIVLYFPPKLFPSNRAHFLALHHHLFLSVFSSFRFHLVFFFSCCFY